MRNVFTPRSRVTAQKDHESWNVFTPRSRVTAQKDHESCGMCLLTRGEKTYVFTVNFEKETTLTLPVMASDAIGRVFSSVEHAHQYRKALDVDCGLCDPQ